MKKLSIILIAALLTLLAVGSTQSAKADIEVDIHCGCETPTPTPTPLATETPEPTTIPSETPTSTNNSTPPNGQVGAPICTAAMPDNPIVTSVVRKSTSATLTWTKVSNADHYMIFYGVATSSAYGSDPGSHEFGVPNTGNVTTYTIGALNPRLKYYFDVRAVNDCQPSSGGQVLGASTSVLASTSSDLTLPRVVFGIIASGAGYIFVKKYSI